jgi:K+:H+ antiporter
MVRSRLTPPGQYDFRVEETAPAVLELGLVLLAAALAGWLARRVALPAVLGYLAVGLVISPFTPGYVADREHLRLLADIGVVLLLFEVGIELDIVRLRREQPALTWAAPLQTLLTMGIGAGVASLLGLPLIGAAVLGLCVALSSGVVIVNITRSARRTTDRTTEEALLGWSALQDVAGVAVGAILVGFFGVAGLPAPIALAGLVLFFVLAQVYAWALPRLLRTVRLHPDLFLLVSVASGLAIAGLASVFLGVPLALAAFVAGLAVAEGPDAAEARLRLGPFRDLFAVLFFVALGTLLDPALLPAALPWAAVLLVLLLVGKGLLSYLLARVARLPARPLQLAVGLSQMGEFSFVLASAAVAARALPVEVYSAVLLAVIVSIAGSTVAVRLVAPADPPVAPPVRVAAL